MSTHSDDFCPLDGKSTSPRRDFTSPGGDEKIPLGGLTNERFFRTTTTTNNPTSQVEDRKKGGDRDQIPRRGPPGGI